MGAPASTPDSDHPFKVIPETEAKYLPKEQAQVFRHTVAQILLILSRARRDIQISFALLIMHVNQNDEYDWFNIVQAINYLKGMRSLKLKLCIDDLSIVKWWVDVSYADTKTAKVTH